MTGVQTFIIISAVLIAIVTYSALVVSSKQEQRIVTRIKADNKLGRHHYSPHESFAFEASEELTREEDDDFDDLKGI